MVNKNKVFFAVAAAFVVLDQLTKFLVRKLAVGDSINIIPNVFNIMHSQNHGAGFGLLQGQINILIFFSIFVVGIILYYYDQIPKELNIFVALILGGTIGNLIDRITFGYVTDFISIWIWPGFNVADIGITVGAVFLIIYLLTDGDLKRLKFKKRR